MENFFRNELIRNKNCLWRLCLLTDRDEISNLNRGPSIDAFYQVLVQLAKWFLWKFTSQSIYHFIFLKIHQQFPSCCLKSYSSLIYSYLCNQCLQRYDFESRSKEVYSIQHYVIKFVSDLRHVVRFLWVLRFPPPIKLTTTI